MSESRKALAKVLDIEEECVKCENCSHAEIFFLDTYICGTNAVSNDFFCLFFNLKGKNDEEKSI